MVQGISAHNMAAMKNKLFSTGGRMLYCEVFHSTSNKFVLLKQAPRFSLNQGCLPTEVITVGRRLVVFGELSNTVLYYDVDNGTWSERSFEISY